MKQIVKSLDCSEDCFGCIGLTFSGFSYKKKKAGIFDVPQTRTLLKDHNFVTAMTAVEARVRNAFGDVVHNFPGNTKVTNHKI